MEALLLANYVWERRVFTPYLRDDIKAWFNNRDFITLCFVDVMNPSSYSIP